MAGIFMDKVPHLVIYCPGCAAEYHLPLKYCGMDALCDNRECGIIFGIPTLESLKADEEAAANPVPDPEAAEETVEETLEMERSKLKVGMIPKYGKISPVDTSNYIMPESKTTREKRKNYIF